MSRFIQLIPPEQHRLLKRRPQPRWIDPTKATLTYEYFWSKDWAYEWKLDGERVLAAKRDGLVRLYSRNQTVLNGAYPEIVDALQKVPGDWWLDGEIVAFEGQNTSFRKLQERMHIKNEAEARASRTPVYYYLFDCMYADGYGTAQLPYSSRRRILHSMVQAKDPLRLLPIEQKAGAAYFKSACKKGWEGLIAKDLSSTYESKRTRKWLKFKCSNGQELIIIGFTEPQGSRQYFGALLLGFYDGNRLCYAGKVGTGFNFATLKSLYEQMKVLETTQTPVNEPVHEKTAHWLKPVLVAQIGFTEWTQGNKLRHPRYLGLRDDKKPKEVIRENT